MSNQPEPPAGYQLLDNNWLRTNKAPHGTLWASKLGDWTNLYNDLAPFNGVLPDEECFTYFVYCAPIEAITLPTLLSDLEALAAEWDAEAKRLDEEAKRMNLVACIEYNRGHSDGKSHDAALLRALIQNHAK